MRGDQSDVLNLADVRHFLELVPHAEFATITGARHMVAGDDNVLFDKVLDDFLERRIQPRLQLFDATTADNTDPGTHQHTS